MRVCYEKMKQFGAAVLE